MAEFDTTGYDPLSSVAWVVPTMETLSISVHSAESDAVKEHATIQGDVTLRST